MRITQYVPIHSISRCLRRGALPALVLVAALCLKASEEAGADFQWVPGDGEAAEFWRGEGALPRMEAGQWESPRIEVEPGAYYRISFRSKGERGAFWGALFEDADAEPIIADSHDSVDPGVAGDWGAQTAVVRTAAEAHSLFLRFHSVAGGYSFDALTVERVSREEARIEIDQWASELPLIAFFPPADRAERLPRTTRTLLDGGKLRMVMLGDSICNDTSQSIFELLIMDALPGVEVEVITSVRGSTGAPWYQEAGRVETYVLRHNPDLVVLAGISHSYDVEAMRSVIRQVREGSDAEILVLNDSVTPHDQMRRRAFSAAYMMRLYRNHDEAKVRREISQRIRDVELFPHRLRRMCQEEDVAFFDIRSAWDDYILRSGVPEKMLLRDAIHANRLGKQVAGRLLYRYLVP